MSDSKPAIGTVKVGPNLLDASQFENKDYAILVAGAEPPATVTTEPITGEVETGDLPEDDSTSSGADKGRGSTVVAISAAGDAAAEMPAYLSPLAVPEGATESFEYWSVGELMSFQLEAAMGMRWQALGSRAVMDGISMVKSFGDMINSFIGIAGGGYSDEVNPMTGGATGTASAIRAEAQKVNGLPYSNKRRIGPSSFDCSGLAWHLLSNMGGVTNSDGTKLGLTTAGGYWMKAKSNLLQGPGKVGDTAFTFNVKPGDRLGRYGKNDNCGHIIIYIGNSEICEAVNGGVRIIKLAPSRRMTWARIPGVEAITQDMTNV
jgi:hypothetical protein